VVAPVNGGGGLLVGGTFGVEDPADPDNPPACGRLQPALPGWSKIRRGNGGVALDASRGEPAFVLQLGDQAFAFVLEGLGTKSMIARLIDPDVDVTAHHFADVAYDTVAAIVNDLCCVGAAPRCSTRRSSTRRSSSACSRRPFRSTTSVTSPVTGCSR